MEIKDLPLKEILPYARNPRKNKHATEKVAASIKEFGFRQPIVVDSEMVIVAGHTRFYAAKKLKLKTVPVHVASDLSPAKAKAYRIADNRTHEEAEWDEELLGLELGELKEMDFADLTLTGFDAAEIEQYLHLEPSGEGDGAGDDEPTDNYKEQYGVIVVCENEDQQEEIYAKLTEQGYNCKVVVT